MKLETLMEQSLNEIKELRQEVKDLGSTFIIKADYDKDINEIRNDISLINKKRWIQNTLSAILGAILTLLIGFFIANVGR